MTPMTDANGTGPVQAEEDALLRLARERSAEGRQSLIGSVSDLYFGRETVLTEQERVLMTGILKRLVREVAAPLRRSLAERLSNDPDAPADLLAALAGDRMDIAGSILLKSPALLDLELVEIIRHRSLDHQLAVAMRRSASETFGDVLAEDGHGDVIKALLGGADAALSEAVLAYLFECAQSLDSFQEPILRPRELPPRLARKMHLWVSAALRQHILDGFAMDAMALDDAIEALAPGASDAGREPDGAHADRAMGLARRLSEAGRITPQLLVGALRQGEVPLFQALLCRLSGLRRTLVRRLLFEPRAECLAALFRALSFDKPTFATVFLLSRRARPGGAADPRELSYILAFFDRTAPAAARAVVARWRRDPEYLDAIRQVSDGRQTLERVLQETRAHGEPN